MSDDELEAALRRVMTRVPQADERVSQRLESRALPPQKRTLAWWPSALVDWDFAPAWPRVAALACAAALGITVGLSNIGLRIAADLNLVHVASNDDANAFDVDSVTGLRP
jgi:hypothetical protein